MGVAAAPIERGLSGYPAGAARNARAVPATFREAWEERVEHEVDGLRVPFLGRATLLKNKRAVGRPQDLADVDALETGSAGKKDYPKR